MILRFIWGLQGVDNVPTTRCCLVSHAIPFDIGWQTYWVDLGDAFNSQPEQTSVTDCPSTIPNWTYSPSILGFRVDPDENITSNGDPIITGGGPFHHQIDWIRLNAIDSVARQHQPGSPETGPHRIYLPFVMTGATNNSDMGGLPSANMSFQWDTGGVSPDTYYICARATGGGNTATYCSEAPVIVQ